MGFDFFTIHSLAAELAPCLEGRRIEQAGSTSAELGLGCGPQEHLHARLGQGGGVCLRPGPLPGELDCREGAERYLRHARIEEVWAERRERLLCLRLSRQDRSGAQTYGRLVFELIHPRFQAVLFSEQSNRILGVWAARAVDRLKVGQPYTPPPGARRLLPGEDSFEVFSTALRQVGGRLDQALARLLAGADRVVAAQLLQRTGLCADGTAADEEQLRKVWEAAAELYGRPPRAQGYVWRQAGQCFFSGLEPAGPEQVQAAPISQAILQAQAAGREEERGEEALLRKRLRRELGLLQRRQQAVAADLEEAGQAEQFERQGNILMAQLAAVQPGAERVELADIYDISGQGRVTVELDPRRTPAENGRRLLQTAGKYRRRQELLPLRLRALEEGIRKVEGFLQGGRMQGEEAGKWLEKQGTTGPGKQRGPREAAHPRRYRTSTGWSVWAGRNNRENDLLTHRLAAQNDIWFHAHGYPGAHVVLRREGRKEEPSNQTLREAASLAAHWSKGKTARKVAVVYTLVKFVSKPRGGAPGQAVIRREKTLVVEPGLLAEEDAGILSV